MNPDREYLIATLCRQILGMRDPDDPRDMPVPAMGIQDAAGARVRIELQGMVHGITRQIWIDQGAYTQRMVAEIRRQAAEINLDEVIAKRVKEEIARSMSEIGNYIRKEVHALVYEAVRERMGGLPAMVANQVTDRVIKDVVLEKSR